MEPGGGQASLFEKDYPLTGEERVQVMAQETTGKPDSKRNKDILAQTACRELMTYGLWDHKTRAKQYMKKYLLRRQTAPEDLIFWPTGLLAAGLWEYRQAADAAGSHIDQALAAYYERWMKKGCPVYYLDDLLAGETLLSAYGEYRACGRENALVRADNAKACGEAVEKLVGYALHYPTDETGSFPYRAAQNNGYVFVDAVGLACPFLYRYGMMYDRPEAMELAVRQIVNFAAYGMDGVTGLPYHGYAARTAYKYGIIGWGRAVGWLLRGMAGCMDSEYGADRLRDAYIGLVDAALACQHRDGYFSWQLQAADGPADTSATGMICAALKRGLELHILEGAEYEQALRAGRNAVYGSVRDGRVYGCSGECEGFGQYPQRYGAYPWALGPALML